MNTDEVKSNVTKLACIGLGYLSGRWHLSGDTIMAMATDAGAFAALVYGYFSHRGMIKVPEGSKVLAPVGVLGFIMAAFLIGFMSPSAAADLRPALKAAPAVFDPVGSGGWYVGGGTELVSSKEKVADTSILSQSGSLGLIGGYGRGNGVSWWQVQGEVYWKNLDGNGLCGLGTSCSVSSRFSSGVWLKVGGPITNTLLNALPQVGSLFPGLSQTTIANNVFPYLALGVAPEDVSASLGLDNARAWVIPVGARAGMITKLTNGSVSDSGIEVDFAGSGFALGGAKVNPGVAYKAYLHFAFGA